MGGREGEEGGGGGGGGGGGYERDGAMRESHFYFGYFWSVSNM